MKAIQVKCGSCGAGLDVQEGSDWITCEYCGSKSRIQRRTGLFKLEELVEKGAAVSVERTSSSARMIIIMSFVLPLLLTGGIVLFLVVGGGATESGLAAVVKTVGGSKIQWEGVGGALFADVNGDGQADVVGRVRAGDKQDLVHLAAFDSRDGKKLWQGEPLGKYTDTFQGKAAIVGDAVLYGSTQGELHAYGLKDGQPLWRIPLGEKTSKFCRDRSGLVAVMTADDKLHRLNLKDGSPAQAEEGPDSRAQSCVALSYDRREGDGQLILQRRFREKTKGMKIQRTWQLGSDGPMMAVGTAHPGTRVPMVAVFSAQRELVWKSEVPGADRLSVRDKAPELHTFDSQHLMTLVQSKDHQSPAKLVAFSTKDGQRLWTTSLSTTMPHSALQISAGLALVSSWGRLDAYKIDSGQLAYTIGWSMK